MSATQGLPRRIGAFEVLNHLGRGRTRDVFEVRAADGEPLALKWLHAALDPRRVERELHVARRVRHPRLASFRECGLHEERPWVTMELVEGAAFRSAATAIRTGPGPATARYGAIAALIADVADALGAMHDAGLIHRDLRAETVVVDRDGHAVIIDVGVAKPVDALVDPDAENLSFTQDVASDARLRSLSPERIRGEEATRGSDLYSLGVLLYEALTGAFPCDGVGMLEIAAATLNEVPTPPHLRDPKVPEPLSILASELLAKDPRDEARLSSTGGDAARAQLLQELRIRVEEMERADASGTRRREVAAALDLLQQMLAAEAPLVDDGRRAVTTNPSVETLAARAPGSAR